MSKVTTSGNTSDNTQAPPALGMALIGAGCFAFSLWYLWFFIPNHDIAVHLKTAHLLTMQARYGMELWEINPPLISVWLKIIQGIATLFHIPAWGLHTVAIGLLAFLSGLLIYRVLSCMTATGKLHQIIFVSAYIIGLHGIAAFSYTQREFMMLCLMAPGLLYLSFIASNPLKLDLDNQSKLSWICNISFCIGCLLKPHFIIVYIAAYAVAFTTPITANRKKLLPLFLSGGAIAALYLGILAYWGWIIFYLDYRHIFAGYVEIGQTSLTLFMPHILPIVMTFIAALCLFFGPQAADHTKKSMEKCSLILASFSLLLLCLGLWQGKGYYYHFIPSKGVALLAILLALHPILTSAYKPTTHLPRWRAALAAGCIAFSLVGFYQLAQRSWTNLNSFYNTHDVEQTEAAHLIKNAPDGCIAIIGTEISAFHALSLWHGHELCLSFPGLWTIPGALAQLSEPELKQHLSLIGDLVARDISNNPPALLLVFADGREIRTPKALDYIAMLSYSPAFAKISAEYQKTGEVAGYDVYKRR